MLTFLISAASVIIWIGVIAKLDTSSNYKEERNHYLVFFIAGMASSVPALLLYYILPWIDYSWQKESWMIFVNSVLIIGPVEEFSKFLLFFILALKMKSIREPRDGMLQAASVGLGFAVLENFLYAAEYGIIVHVIRSVLCIMGHIVWAGIWGIFAGRFIFEKKNFRKKSSYLYIVLPLAVSAVFHGLYDYLLEDDSLVINIILVITIFYLGILITYKLYMKTGTGSPYKLYPLKEFNKAITLISMALEHDPENHTLNKRIGLYYLYAGAYESAAEHFDACIKVNPENFYCHALSGIALILSGRREAGIRMLEDSVKKISGNTLNVLRKNIRAVLDDGQSRNEILGLIDNNG